VRAFYFCLLNGFRGSAAMRYLLSERADHMTARNVLGAGFLISAALLLGACNRAQPPDDKVITGEIQAKLYQDAALRKRDISIIAQNGFVVLSGQVNSEDERAAAERLATATSGVKQVLNQLVVVGPPPVAKPTGQKPPPPEKPKSR